MLIKLHKALIPCGSCSHMARPIMQLPLPLWLRTTLRLCADCSRSSEQLVPIDPYEALQILLNSGTQSKPQARVPLDLTHISFAIYSSGLVDVFRMKPEQALTNLLACWQLTSCPKWERDHNAKYLLRWLIDNPRLRDARETASLVLELMMF